MSEHAGEVIAAATAAAGRGLIDQAGLTRIQLLARMWEAGFSTGAPGLRMRDPWHFARGTEVALSQEILRVRFGHSGDPSALEAADRWRLEREQNLSLLAEASEVVDPRWLPLIEQTWQSVRSETTRIDQRLPVPNEPIAAAVATLQMYNFVSPARDYLRPAPARELPPDKVAVERTRVARLRTVELRVWPQVLAALHRSHGASLRSGTAPLVLSEAMLELAPTRGDVRRAELAAELARLAPGTISTQIALRGLTATPESYGSILTDIARTELNFAAAGPRTDEDGGQWKQGRHEVRQAIVVAVSRSWHSTGVHAPHAAELAHRADDALRSAIEDGLDRRILLDDLGNAFGRAPALDHSAVPAVETVPRPDQLAELGAALAAAPSPTAAVVGETLTTTPDVGTTAQAQGAAL
ncbi:hypothetical protein ACIGO9_30140 [Nocardia asteroides]|uniref:hypothetical protein n=1 Tax=Nocardia asteroides TaxID=1824 RepID=UPI0037C6C1EA